MTNIVEFKAPKARTMKEIIEEILEESDPENLNQPCSTLVLLALPIDTDKFPIIAQKVSKGIDMMTVAGLLAFAQHTMLTWLVGDVVFEGEEDE